MESQSTPSHPPERDALILLAGLAIDLAGEPPTVARGAALRLAASAGYHVPDDDDVYRLFIADVLRSACRVREAICAGFVDPLRKESRA